MKNTLYLLLVLVTVFSTSCEKHWNYDFEEIQYGFESEIHEYSKELILMKVTDNIPDIRLKGNIELYDGSVKITLIRPDGNTVFEEIITENTKSEVNQSFPAQKGCWKLRYESNKGKGFINLHMNQ